MSKKTTASVYLDREALEHIEFIALQEDRSNSQIIKYAIEEYIERYKKKNKKSGA
jgi:predicted transcriptional regulator